jgi:hypothetical protein
MGADQAFVHSVSFVFISSADRLFRQFPVPAVPIPAVSCSGSSVRQFNCSGSLIAPAVYCSGSCFKKVIVQTAAQINIAVFSNIFSHACGAGA